MSSLEIDRAQEKLALEAEFAQILKTPILIGHRGMNNRSDPREMRAAEEYKERVDQMVIRANEIAWQLKALELGVEPDSFEYLGYAHKYKADQTDVSDFHREDKRVPLYLLSWTKVAKSGEMVAIYRKKGSTGVPLSDLQHPDRLWVKIAKEFYRSPREIEEPIVWLTELRDLRVHLGEKPKLYDDAIAELKGLFSQAG